MKFANLKNTARGVVLDALAIEVRRTADMPEDLRTRILTNRPSAEEIANGRWNDED